MLYAVVPMWHGVRLAPGDGPVCLTLNVGAELVRRIDTAVHLVNRMAYQAITFPTVAVDALAACDPRLKANLRESPVALIRDLTANVAWPVAAPRLIVRADALMLCCEEANTARPLTSPWVPRALVLPYALPDPQHALSA